MRVAAQRSMQISVELLKSVLHNKTGNDNQKRFKQRLQQAGDEHFSRISQMSAREWNHLKKAGVIFALSSAPHFEYGNSFRNHGGTAGKPLMTARCCSSAVLPYKRSQTSIRCSWHVKARVGQTVGCDK